MQDHVYCYITHIIFVLFSNTPLPYNTLNLLAYKLTLSDAYRIGGYRGAWLLARLIHHTPLRESQLHLAAGDSSVSKKYRRLMCPFSSIAEVLLLS